MLIQEDVQGGEIMEIKRVKLSEIRPYEKNPRKNDRAVDAVAASIKSSAGSSPSSLTRTELSLPVIPGTKPRKS